MAEMTVEQQRALAIARARRRRAEAAPEVSRTEATLSGFGRGLGSMPKVIESLNIESNRRRGEAKRFGPKLAAAESRNAAIAQQAQQSRPNYFAGGQIAGELAPALAAGGLGGAALKGVGGALARVAPRAGGVVQRVGTAMQTGGVGTVMQTGGVGAGRTAAQTAAMTRGARAGRLAERVVGGAVGGAAGAALTDQDVTTGAAFGGGLPVMASVLKRVGGAVPDLFKLPTLKAAEIIRKSLGENVEAARAAFAALPADSRELARQTLVKLGIEPRVFMAVAEGAERLRPDEVAGILGEQAAAREARLAAAGGGPTATATRSAAETGRRDVSAATGPAREIALGRANIAGREVPAAEALAAAARQRADEITASGIVPRMRGLEDRSRGQLDAVFQNPEFFTQGNPVERIGAIAEGAGQRADDAISAQMGSRQVARDMEDYVADLAAQGMQPLEVSPIVQQIRSMAGQPGTRADDLQRGTLTKLADQLEGLADQNGVIDARDLYQLRKTGVNDIVDRLLGGAQPSSGTKERAAALMTSIRPMIDQAIEGAGGTGWKDYLSLTRRGFEAVNRQELGGKAAQMAKESPNEFIALMRGERPKVVEDIMGTGQYDIGGMALADPQRYQGLTQSANELDVLNRMSSLAGEGRTAANELIGRERPRFARAATRLGLAAFPPGRIAADAAQTAMTSALAPRVQQQLATGAMGGQNMLALMNQYPTSARASEMISQLSPETRNALAQLLRSGTFKLNQPSE